MYGGSNRSTGRWLALVATLALGIAMLVVAAPAGADPGPPWDGTPISPGLGPTYGEAWCAPTTGEAVDSLQGPPLALIPYAAIGCSLAQFQTEAANAGVPARMTYSVIGQSAGGRDIYAAVVNDLETADQQRDYSRLQQVRALELVDPAGAQALLDSFGDDVKMPLLYEANIHGGERESTDAIMQVLRDLVTTPYGTNDVVDEVLDHAYLVVIPTINPDGRVIGQRSNAAGIDMNRDFLVQSQPEVKAEVALQHEVLPTAGIGMHGYVNPTLVDGLTKPHNPGIEYDLFLKWNQPRLDANEAALAGVGMGITRPVNQWNANGNPSPPPTGPAYAEGWDDWGPFYTQTYMAFLGTDSSTSEMCSSTSPTGGCAGLGRLGSKIAQYLVFYSSANFWLSNRHDMMFDQIEIFRRGVEGASRVPCCSDPAIAARGFDETNHNWMVEYPKAFLIPFDGTTGSVQRSDAEANRMVQWLLDNGITVERTRTDLTWGGQFFPKRSYVVWMDQPFRGLAYTALAAGQDISSRISQLYAPPGAWSHGLLWGADTLEISDPSFAPKTIPITAPNPLVGLLSNPDKSYWYSVAPRGVTEFRGVLDLLRSGVDGYVAEASFTSSGGQMPAGSLIFPHKAGVPAKLRAFAKAVGVQVFRSTGPMPATTKMTEAPKIAILVNNAAPTATDQFDSLQRIFGSDAQFVSTVAGSSSVQWAATDPLQGYDVIYNTGTGYPADPTSVNIASSTTPGASESGNTVTIATTSSHNLVVGATVTIAGVAVAGYNGTFTVDSVPASNRFTYTNPTSGLASSGGGTVSYSTATARGRLNAFFARGGGYIGTAVSSGNFTFLSSASLVSSPLTLGSQSAGGGIGIWSNTGGTNSALTGAYPSQDFIYLPSNISYFSALPGGAVVDGRYLNSTTDMFVAGLWLNRDPAIAGAPVIVHGDTTAGSRYLGYATNPFSRIDAEREWPLMVQAALWTDLTDES
jgi:Zinc carboxypeptidase